MRESTLRDLEAADQAPHYLAAVTEMGENRQIVAQEDIYAENGMKLLAKGARINASQRERLSLHKLRTPLDFILSTEEPVDANELVVEAGKLLAADVAMLRLAERCGDPLGFKAGIGALALPPPLQFRLTVMRDRRPELFTHSLKVALIAWAVAVQLKYTDRQKQDLLLAGLCHDLGEMHTDPALLARSHRMGALERRFVHVHPITGYVLLRDMAGLPPAVAQAVLQHHERLDGSGYPHALAGPAVGELARVLAVAEMLEGAGQWHDLRRIDVLLRLNYRRIDGIVTHAVRALLRADMDAAVPAQALGATTDRLAQVANVMLDWESVRQHAGAHAFLGDRIDMLRSLVLQAGIDPRNTRALAELAAADPYIQAELHATLAEMTWIMADIAHEVERRVPELPPAVAGFVAALRPA
ncbi:MAG: HD-GYP domain-containing protein [Telluria sp.]